MTITKDHIGGLVFLSLSLAYGSQVDTIRLLPGDELEPFHAQTLPYWLSIMGAVLSVALILTAERGSEHKLSLRGYDFALVAKLLALIVAYGVALEWIGFLLSTTFFLLGGFWLLGERRIRVSFGVAILFSLGIWFVLSQLLDIYLAPGQLFSGLMGD